MKQFILQGVCELLTTSASPIGELPPSSGQHRSQILGDVPSDFLITPSSLTLGFKHK